MTRFILRLSLFANIVLVFWALWQRTLILESQRYSEQIIEGIEDAITQVSENTKDIREVSNHLHEQRLRTIASIDQMDAFLEERGRYVK